MTFFVPFPTNCRYSFFESVLPPNLVQARLKEKVKSSKVFNKVPSKLKNYCFYILTYSPFNVTANGNCKLLVSAPTLGAELVVKIHDLEILLSP